MAVVHPPIYQEVYYFLASSPNQQDILTFRPSEATQQRINTLLEASKEGRISADEQAELDEFEQVEHFVRMLKLHTRQKIQN